MNGWKKKKAAIYLRRSKGDTGTTQEQLGRIKKLVRDLEKSGKIAKVDWNIVGKDINKKIRFKASRDLKKKGGVFNEGEQKSASELASIRDRPVLQELVKRMQAGEYDIVIAETLDRFSRDPLSFAWGFLPIWREGGKIFWGLKDGRGYGIEEPFNESIITTYLMWGGEAKKGESRKSRDALEKKIDVGYITKPKAELLGSGTKGAGMNYREFWKVAKEAGETPEGRLMKPTDIGRIFKKDHTWASTTYEMFKQWDELGVLSDWFDAVDAINQYINNHAGDRGYPANSWKTPEIRQLVKTSNGFLAYPAGVNPSEKYPDGHKQFIRFPNPVNFDLEELATTKDPNEIRGWAVLRESLADKKLLKYQTQFRGKGGRGKRLL